MGFNPRARDGREGCLSVEVQEFKSFNPRARDGREKSLFCLFGANQVSIHAPVMGAKINKYAKALISSFNPRARDGREVANVSIFARIVVSIHAPVMGAN